MSDATEPHRSADRYRLALVEAETGIVLTAEGAWAEGGAGFVARFSTWEGALLEKEALLRRFAFAEVVITDELGETAPAIFRDDQGLAQYSKQMNAWRRWRRSSWLFRLLKSEPPNPRQSPAPLALTGR